MHTLKRSNAMGIENNIRMYTACNFSLCQLINLLSCALKSPVLYKAVLVYSSYSGTL